MTTDRPTLLIVTRNLPPLVGGMERLNSHLVSELAQSYDVTVIGPRGVIAAGAHRILSSPSNHLPIFLLWATWTAVKVAMHTRPRWVFGGSGLVAPLVMFAAWLSRAHYGLYVHGLDIVAKHPIYRTLWLPTIRRADLCLANSTNTRELAASVGVNRNKLDILFPGVHIDRPPGDAKRFRESIDVSGEFILLSVGRLTARKGVAEFVEHVFPEVIRNYPSAKLVIIGDDAPDALLKGRSNQRARIVEAAAAQGVADNVLLLGPVDEGRLSDAFAAADIHIFPVIAKVGDVEGFGMVAVEAAAAGVPTIAYAVGGVPDAVRTGESGTLVSPDDHFAFTNAVLAQLAEGKELAANERRRFARNFSWSAFGIRLRSLLSEREQCL